MMKALVPNVLKHSKCHLFRNSEHLFWKLYIRVEEAEDGSTWGMESGRLLGFRHDQSYEICFLKDDYMLAFWLSPRHEVASAAA